MTTQSYAQNTPISCGFVPTAAQQIKYQAVMAQMNSGNAPQQLLADIPLNASIPIYFWVNKPDLPSSISAAQLIIAIEKVNSYFHFPNNAHFTFCGMSYVDDPRWYSLPDAANYPVNRLIIDYHKDNAINVYLPKVRGELNLGAIGASQSSLILQAIGDGTPEDRIRDVAFAHELAHCFSLAHTHNDGTGLGAVKELVIRDPDPTKPNAPNFSVSADLMGSTPADIVGCERLGCTYSYFCTLRDDNGDLYTPDLSNIMSYHFCSTLTPIFTPEQQTKMNIALQTEQNFLINAPCVGNIANVGRLFRERVTSDPLAECFISGNDVPILAKNANIAIQNSSNGSPVCYTSITSDNTSYYQSCSFPKNSSITITPTKNTNYKEGVTTLDVALMSRHILGYQLFTSPYQMLAADVDNSGEIDATDMYYTRRLILNYISTFPNNVGSWRFVPNYFLEQPSFLSAFNSDPFIASFQGYCYSCSNSYMDKVSLNTSITTSLTRIAWSFAPFKVGDVNSCSTTYSAAVPQTPTFDPNSLSSARVANNLYTISTARTISMNSAEERTIVLKTKNAVSVMAFQLGMRFLKDKFKINTVQKGEFDAANDVFEFNKEDKGEFRALWYDKRGQLKTLKAGTVLLTAKVKANVNVADLLTVLNLDDQILKNEFYDAKGKLVPVDMEWTNDANATVTNTMTVNAFPNPFTNEVSFDINAPVAGAATITISNIITGQSHVTQKQLVQGANLITINNVASLSAGALTYTVVVGTQVVNGTITKAR